MNRLKLLVKISSVIAAAAIAGCSTLLTVRSNPIGAEIFLTDLSSNDSKKIGETPLMKSWGDLKFDSSKGPYIVTLKKEGFADKEIYFPSPFGTDVTLDVAMTASLKGDDLNFLIDELFAARSMARKGDLDGSIQLLNRLEKKYSKISAVYEIRGSVFLLKKDISSALRDYEMAIQLHPKSTDLKTAYESILKSIGEDRRLPAAAPTPGAAP